MKTSTQPRLLFAVTHPMTAAILMRGQIPAMRSHDFLPALLCSPGEQLQEILQEEGLTVFPVPMEREIAPLKDLVALWRCVKALRRFRPNLVSAGTPKAGLLVLLAAWICRIPERVYLVRGLRLESAKGWKLQILRMTERFACWSATRVAPVSRSLKGRLLDLELTTPEKCFLVGEGASNGVNPERFRRRSVEEPEIQQRLQSLQLPEAAPVIGFVGRLTRDKGIADLLQALEQVWQDFPEVCLLLVGDFEEGDPVGAEVRRRIEIESRLFCTGFVKDPAPFYSLMQLLVFPSLREGFPNTPLEAAAAELPVVGYAATGTVDAVVDGVTGLLVEPGDVMGLARSMKRLLSSSEMRLQMGQAARERVLQSFQNETVWNNWANFYWQCLGRTEQVDQNGKQDKES